MITKIQTHVDRPRIVTEDEEKDTEGLEEELALSIVSHGSSFNVSIVGQILLVLMSMA